MIIVMETIGDRLEQLRASEDLNKVQMAAIGKTSKQRYGRIVNGDIEQPAPDSLIPWVQHFRVRLEWLVSGRPPKGATQSQPVKLDGDIILASYREAVAKFEAMGMSARSFKPHADPDHAELLALAIAAQLSPPLSDSKTSVNVEVGRGAARTDRKGSGTIGKDRSAEVGREAATSPGKRRKSAA